MFVLCSSYKNGRSWILRVVFRTSFYFIFFSSFISLFQRIFITNTSMFILDICNKVKSSIFNLYTILSRCKERVLSRWPTSLSFRVNILVPTILIFIYFINVLQNNFVCHLDKCCTVYDLMTSVVFRAERETDKVGLYKKELDGDISECDVFFWRTRALASE